MTEALPSIAGAERLIVVVGPSGAGKDSVLCAWRAELGAAAPVVARRVITRAPEAADPTKVHEAVTGADFAGMRVRGVLATWWQAHGLDYGVRWQQLEPLAAGRWVVLNGSRAHLPALRAQAPGLRVVALSAPGPLRAQRLAARAREDAFARERRLVREIADPVDADLALVNEGELRHSVDALHQWWERVRAAG